MKKITYRQYFDKVWGGWTGKCLGGTIGCFEGTKQITNLNIYDLLPDKMVANDDLDIQLVWIDVLLEKGVNFTSEHLMKAWIDQYDYNFGEYATGRRNYKRGLKPPVCGKYSNRFYITGMGCPIRSEVWGMISPGNGSLAASYAYKDGILDHEGESVWAEQFLSVIEANAFFEDDLNVLIDEGLKYIPCDCLVYQCICEARRCFESGITWQETWRSLRDNYGHPDCTYAPQNLGIIAMALLYGGKDFDKTLTIAVNSAWDVDCTCSTTAALLGIIIGYEAFDKKWLSYIGDEVITLARPNKPMNSIKLISDYTCRAGVTLSKAGFTDVEITDVPQNMELLGTASYAGRIGIEVDYCGDPVVNTRKLKKIKLIISNNTQEYVEGILVFTEIPDSFELNPGKESIHIDPYESRALEVTVGLKNNAAIINDTNLVMCEFIEEGKTAASHEFGLCGAPVTLVAGPFYDTYMEWLKVEDMPEKRLLKSGSEVVIIPEAAEEWGNHRVDIDKTYMNEDFAEIKKTRMMFEGGRKCSILEDRYILKDAFGFNGSACAYFYQEIFCPEEREGAVFIGSSDPYKLWMNGVMLHVQRENKYWYPNHDVLNIKFNKGINYLVVKIARKGAENTFSMAFRHKQVLWGYDSAPYMTDLSFSVFNNAEKMAK